MASLVFDSGTHTYTLGGRKLPSVTEVLGDCRMEDFSMVSDQVLEAARDFGRNVHLACHLSDTDALDWQSLDPALVPFVEAWQAFLEDTGAVVIASEQPVAHEQLGYAGTPDRVLAWGSRVVVPDLKATAAVPRTVGIQTAAYAKAYQAMHGGREPDRYCIHLRPGTTRGRPYKSHVRNDPADWSLFVSCLNVWRFRNAA